MQEHNYITWLAIYVVNVYVAMYMLVYMYTCTRVCMYMPI